MDKNDFVKFRNIAFNKGTNAGITRAALETKLKAHRVKYTPEELTELHGVLSPAPMEAPAKTAGKQKTDSNE